MQEPSLAGLDESWELSAEAVLTPLLRPGETLTIALSGATGWFEGVSFVELVTALPGVLVGASTSELNRTTYIGSTGEELVFAICKPPKQPARLQRAPLGSVSIVKFKESRTPFLIDVLVMDAGTKRLTLSTGDSLRPLIRELAATLARPRQAAGTTGSAGHLHGALAQPVPRLPLHVRLARLLASALQDVGAALRADGPAQASIRASRYSFALFGAAIAAGVVFIICLVALGPILSTGLSAGLWDVLLFILLLPALSATLLSLVAALLAAGFSIYSIFKRRERPQTVLAALLKAVALLSLYALVAFGAVLLAGE